jgi:hypothetical protein
VTNAVKPDAEKRVEFSTSGVDYWAASVAVRKSSTKWIRRDRDYLIRMNFLDPIFIYNKDALLKNKAKKKKKTKPYTLNLKINK